MGIGVFISIILVTPVLVSSVRIDILLRAFLVHKIGQIEVFVNI